MSKRQSYSREFKLEALRLLRLGEKTATDLARELGLRRNQLYKWREELEKRDAQSAFPGSGRRPDGEAQLAQLKRDNAELREENEILKKAARYFARQSP